MSEVILIERVAKLGIPGDVVNVKPGYARNFLIPTGKALRATKDNLAIFEKKKAEIEAKNHQRKIDAEKLKTQIDNLMIDIIRQAGEMGQLFGSVSVRDIAAELAKQNVIVSKESVIIGDSIKALGIHPITVSPHADVEITILLNVARNEDDAAARRKAHYKVQEEIAPSESSEEEVIAS
jgi:large subunit ribosomal protein L9